MQFTQPTDHFFCGIILDDINKKCNTKPCPDGTSTNCDFGQACYTKTNCDARIRPDYGVTQPPTIKPTPSPLTSNAREYFSFCGEDWAQANTCKMQWCGNGSKCPNGQSCFADTECNMKDKLDGPPTMKPTEAPVTYLDDVNFRFCGKTYLDAVAQCSVDSYCNSGTHDECPGGEYCWAGVSCNIKDMIQPTTSRPTVYRPPTFRPSRAPLPLDDPRNHRFCGKTWVDADSCARDWCPNGTDDECPVGLICWADTTCHAAEITLAPSKSPILGTTSIERHTLVPSMSPIPYDDPMHTSFCGFSFDDARGHCSVESHCPSGLQQDCPTGQYCWVGTPCNILEFTPPSPLPTQYPSRIQSDTPSTIPSSPPVKATIPQAAVPLTFSPTSRSISQSLTLRPVSTSSNSSNNADRKNQWCGETRFDATRNCGRQGYECPDGFCFQRLQCFVTSQYCESESAISGSASSSPTNPIVVVVPAIHLEQTRPPTLHPTQSRKSVYFPPISKDPISKSPNENVLRVQHIIESIKPALRSEIFVLETRGGALIKSSLYTYEGFLSALLFYSNTGVNDNFFYLGGKQSSTEQIYLEVEFGIANLGLFIAKLMTDTIAYERCTPDLLACGLAALDTTFETQQVRFMCPPSSDIVGMECEDGVGCACTLGFLNQNIGSESPASSKYSGLNFCSSDHQSICNRNISEGAELRWITAMTHWNLLVQRHEGSEMTFIDELHKFVDGGMLDTSFLYAVADLSVLDANPISRESVPKKQQFVENFFKVMKKLSEGHSQSQPASPTLNPVLQQTASPSTILPSAAVIPATNKPTLLSTVPQTPQPTQLPSVTPSTSPSSLQASVPISSSQTNDPVAYFANPFTSEAESETQSICPTFCTEVTPIDKCPSRDVTVPLTISYCSPTIGVYELCRGNGYCGTSDSLNNCGKGRSIYRRIDCSLPSQTAGGVSVVDGGASNPPTASDTPCSLCRREEIRIDAAIILYNGKQSTCAVVQSFLQQSVYASDATCVSAKNELSEACCEATTIEVQNNEIEADSEPPLPSPVETIEPTKRGSDLPWYTKYTESRSNSSGGWLSYFHTGVLICLLSFILHVRS